MQVIRAMLQRVFTVSVVIVLIAGGTAHAARNVILIIPDGCSSELWTTVRSMLVGPGGTLNIDQLSAHGYCHTYSADSFITDSAAAGTALACGVKTNNGILGMDAETTRGDSLTGNPVQSILKLAREAGYATGIISTAQVQHATPAAFYAHVANRDWYQLIANQLVDSDIDVIMGGGKEYMIPAGAIDEEGARARRDDQRNIIDEMKAAGYTYVFDQAGFDAIDPDNTDRLLGIFNAGHMQYEYNRADDTAGEPGLWEMTDKAIQILSKDDEGFFLMVEAARIDHAGHGHMTNEFLWDGIACEKAVGVALDYAREDDDTLLIVVPDHGTGGPHLVGTVINRDGDSRITSMFPQYTLDEDGFPIEGEGRPVAIQWIERTDHTGEDVGVHAFGPGAEKLDGIIENIDVFAVMKDHLEIEENVQTLYDIVDP